MSNLHTNDVPMENDDADSTASGPLSGPMPDIICPCNGCTKKRQAAKLALAAAKGKGHGKGSGSGEPEAAPSAGTVASPEHSPEDEEECEDGLTETEEDKESARQSGELIRMDAGLRLRVWMTTYEMSQLKNHMGKHFKDGQLELAVSCFGEPGSRAATKNIYMKYMEGIFFNYSPGEACSSILVDFTMSKSLLLSSRALQSNRPSVDDKAACFCLPRTALMPAGCAHRHIPVGTTPLSAKKAPWYCSQCSMCLRCWKSFGST